MGSSTARGGCPSPAAPSSARVASRWAPRSWRAGSVSDGWRTPAEDEDARRKAEELARAAHEKRADGAALSAGARGAAIGPTDAWLVGPRLEGAWHYPGGTRVGLAMSSLFGAAEAAHGSPKLRWLELELAPAQALRVAPTMDVVFGVSAAAAAVHVNGVPSVDDVSGEADTWSARAGVFALLEAKLSRGVFFSAGPEAGAVLRRVPFVDSAGDRMRLGGLWLGARASIALIRTEQLSANVETRRKLQNQRRGARSSATLKAMRLRRTFAVAFMVVGLLSLCRAHGAALLARGYAAHGAVRRAHPSE